MKTASITFGLTLDITYSDYLDAQWIADSFLHKSKRFSVSQIPGDPNDPGSIVIEAASSGVTDVKTYSRLRAETYGHNQIDTEVIHCTSKMAALIKDNPEFMAALCEEGVVEWLTPFVLAKSRQSNHPATDTTQP
jgi:hypothetical protein